MSSLREQIEREREAFERSAGMQRAVKALPKPGPEKGEQQSLEGGAWQNSSWENVAQPFELDWRKASVTKKQSGYLDSLRKRVKRLAQSRNWPEVMSAIDSIGKPRNRGEASNLIECLQDLIKDESWTKEDILDMIQKARLG